MYREKDSLGQFFSTFPLPEPSSDFITFYGNKFIYVVIPKSFALLPFIYRISASWNILAHRGSHVPQEHAKSCLKTEKY